MIRAALAVLAGLALVAGCAGCARSGGEAGVTAGGQGADDPAPGEAPAGDAYYLSVCARCAGMLGGKGDTIDRVYSRRDARFCCAECAAAFERDPGAGFARVDGLMIDDQRPHYPLTTSIVSGRPLPARPVEFIWGNRLFRVADVGERAAVDRDPGTHLRALDRAVIAVQRPSYGMPDKCPVQGDILASDTPIDIVVANRMVRVCCMRCVRVVRSRPSQFLALVDYANRHAAERTAGEPPS